MTHLLTYALFKFYTVTNKSFTNDKYALQLRFPILTPLVNPSLNDGIPRTSLPLRQAEFHELELPSWISPEFPQHDNMLH